MFTHYDIDRLFALTYPYWRSVACVWIFYTDYLKHTKNYQTVCTCTGYIYPPLYHIYIHSWIHSTWFTRGYFTPLLLLSPVLKKFGVASTHFIYPHNPTKTHTHTHTHTMGQAESKERERGDRDWEGLTFFYRWSPRNGEEFRQRNWVEKLDFLKKVLGSILGFEIWRSCPNYVQSFSSLLDFKRREIHKKTSLF